MTRSSNSKGTALVVVMVVVVMMALAVYGFVYLMTNEYRSTAFVVEQSQAKMAAQSGQEYVLSIAATSRQQRAELLNSSTAAELFAGIQLEELDSADDTAGWSFAVVTRSDASSGEPGWQFGITDESSKLHLATLLAWDEASPGAARSALSSISGLTVDEVDSILIRLGVAARESVDGESEPVDLRSDGVGASTIPIQARPIDESLSTDVTELSLSSSMSTARGRNVKEVSTGLPTSLDELVSEGVVSPEVMWGEDRDRNYQPDLFATELTQGFASLESDSMTDAEFGLGGDVSSGGRELSALLTVRSAERNQRYDGTPRIWLNQPDLEVLDRQLRETWPEEWVRFVVAYRQFGPASEETPTTGVAPKSWAPTLSDEAAVEIESPLDLIGVAVPVPGDEGATLSLASPFTSDIAEMASYLDSLLDDVTTTSDTVIKGRLNILEAPEEVIRSIPFLEDDQSSQLIEKRREKRASADGGRSPGWLLSEGIVDLATMKRVYPFVSTGGDVFSAQVIGFRDDRTAVVRCTGFFSPDPRPRVDDRQYWQMWGRGFTSNALRNNETSTSLTADR